MKLRKECPHGFYDKHNPIPGTNWTKPPYVKVGDWWECPGGVFLPDDTLVIERIAAFQIVADQDFTVQERQGRHLNGGWHYLTEDEINTLLDALSVRDTE